MPKAPRTHNTAPAVRALICSKAAEGVSAPEISSFSNIHLQTVQRILKNDKDCDYYEDAPKSRWPPKLDDRALPHLNMTLERDHHQSLPTLTNIVNTFTASPVHQVTVQHMMTNQLGMDAYTVGNKTLQMFITFTIMICYLNK